MTFRPDDDEHPDEAALWDQRQEEIEVTGIYGDTDDDNDDNDDD